MRGFIDSYRWAIMLAGVLVAVGFIVHPPLTVAGMGEDIWVPDHVMLLVGLVLSVPAYAILALDRVEPTPLGLVGLMLAYLAMCSFIGVVYFELFIIPTLVHEAPDVLRNGLRVGELKWFLPLTGITFVVSHFILGAAWWRANRPRVALLLWMLGSVGVGLKPILPTVAYVSGAVAFALGLILLARK